MHKFKKSYEAPDLNVSRVEVESSICGGWREEDVSRD